VKLRLRAIFFTGLAIVLGSSGVWAGVLKFKPDGEFGRTGRGRDALEHPAGLAVWERSFLCVAEKGNDSVVRYDQEGKWISTLKEFKDADPPELKGPSSLAFDRRGRLWVVDTGHDRILVLGGEGKVLKVIGSRGVMRGEFREPSDIVFGPDEKVYVADTGNRRIQVLDQEGESIAVWAYEPGPSRGWINRPAILAFVPDSDGFLWVADEDGSKIEKCDLKGHRVETLDATALVQSEVRVRDIAVDPSMDRMFICDAAGNRILAVSWRGKLLTEVPLPPDASPTAVAVNSRLDLFVADSAKQRILVFGKD
jgi:DNA-binding beta-propeller fold protein YncE